MAVSFVKNTQRLDELHGEIERAREVIALLKAQRDTALTALISVDELERVILACDSDDIERIAGAVARRLDEKLQRIMGVETT